jgi:hypothetical protein
MERNLYNSKSIPFLPTLLCVKITGQPESKKMRMGIRIQKGKRQ